MIRFCWHDHRAALVTVCLLILLPVSAGLFTLQRSNINRLERAQAYDAWARYDSNLAGCKRGQVTRADTNAQSDALRQLVKVLDSYLDSAVELRLRTTNPDLAEKAERARSRLRETVAGLRDTEPIDCSAAVKPPSTPRPE